MRKTKFDRYGDAYYTNHEKAKQTNLKNIGHESYLSIKEIYQKGVEASKTPEANRKRKETMRQKYGVDYYTETDEFKEASKAYKEEHKEEIKEKSKATCLKEYGVEYAFQAKEVREKIAQTNLDKYGAENIWASEYGKQKVKETMLKRYGVDHIFKLQSVQDKAQKNSHTPEAMAKMHENRDYREIARKTAETKKK